MAKVAELINVCHTYPGREVPALDRINLSLEKGSRVAVVGQNGSGKTTLSKHFNGLLRPTAGKVLIDGKDIAGMRTGELARFVGYVFQNPNYQLFSPTVREEIEFGLKNLRLPEGERKARFDEAVKVFELKKLVNRQPLSLSGGARKIIALASVYAMHPSILFLDEPTTGQDHPGKERIGRLTQTMSQAGCTVAIITHDMNFVAKYAERVVVMAQGSIISDGRPEDIFSQDGVMQRAHIQPPQIVELAGAFAAEGVSNRVLDVEKLAAQFLERSCAQ